MDDQFCRKCGGSLAAKAESIPSYRSRASLLRRELAILAGGIVLLLAAAFCVWFFLFYQSSPAMVVRRFMDADRDARYADEEVCVLNRWDSEAVFSAFQAARKQAGRSPFGSYTVAAEAATGKTATVDVNLSYVIPAVPGVTAPLAAGVPPGAPAPTIVPVKFVLQYVDGKWKIDASQTLVNAGAALAIVGYTKAAPNLGALPGLTLPVIPGFPAPAAPTTPPGPSTL